jgi:hypothetical protein
MAYQKRRRPVGGKVEVRVTSDFKDVTTNATLLFNVAFDGHVTCWIGGTPKQSRDLLDGRHA